MGVYCDESCSSCNGMMTADGGLIITTTLDPICRCRNGGICTFNKRLNASVCFCMPGYTGLYINYSK